MRLSTFHPLWWCWRYRIHATWGYQDLQLGLLPYRLVEHNPWRRRSDRDRVHLGWSVPSSPWGGWQERQTQTYRSLGLCCSCLGPLEYKCARCTFQSLMGHHASSRWLAYLRRLVLSSSSRVNSKLNHILLDYRKERQGKYLTTLINCMDHRLWRELEENLQDLQLQDRELDRWRVRGCSLSFLSLVLNLACTGSQHRDCQVCR